MQSTNQKTNALESIIGIFLHSWKTPEKVIEALAHLGISISINAIHSVTISLSAESASKLCEVGQTFLATYSYDNFDVDLKTSVPTVKKSGPTLQHLTSTLVFPLEHGVTQEDMHCSDELWKKSHLNPKANPSDIPPMCTWKDLINLHKEPESDGTTPTWQDQFIAWKYLLDLCTHGPIFFHQY